MVVVDLFWLPSTLESGFKIQTGKTTSFFARETLTTCTITNKDASKIDLRHYERDPQRLPSLYSIGHHAGAGMGRHGVALPEGDGECKLVEQRGLGRGAPLRYQQTRF